MKTLSYFVLLAAVSFLLFGCARMSDESTSVMLQHPETMDFVKCDVDQWGTKKSFAKKDQCVQSYISQGYVIWAER